MYRLIMCLAMLVSLPVQAEEITANKLEGSYEYSYKNGDVEGNTYISRDTLEILPVDPKSIYFSLTLQGFNEHSCDAGGIAILEKTGRFVYRSKDTDSHDQRCELVLTVKPEGLSIGDPGGACKNMYCGMRAGFDGYEEFTFARRQPLKDRDKMLNSQAYKAALDEYRSLAVK